MTGDRDFLGIRPGERRQTLWLSLDVMVIVAAYMMVKTVRDAVFLSRFGTRELALVMILVAVTAGTLASLGTRLGARVSLVRRIVLAHAVVAGSLVALWPLFALHVAALPWAFYFWSSFFGLFVLAHFWLLANELHDPRSAKRLFAILGAGAIVGGIIGGELSKQLAPRIGAVNLLPIIAGMFLLSAALGAAAWRAGRTRREAAPPERRTRLLEGLALVRRHAHLRLIATLLLLSTIATTLIEMQVKEIARAHFGADTDAMAAFFGRLTALFSAVSLLVQLVVTPRFLRRFGVGAALLVLPLSLAAGAATIGLHVAFAAPLVTAATVAKIGDGGLRHSLDKAAMELLYVPVEGEVKAKAKPIIDTVADRAGTALTGVAWLALGGAAATAGAPIVGLAASFTFVILGVWLAVIVRARRAYVATLRATLEKRADAAAALPMTSVSLVDQEAWERLLLFEARTYRRHLEDLRLPGLGAAARRRLRARLEDDLARIFRLLGLRYAPVDVQAVWAGLASDEASVRASAIELLDTMVEGKLRRDLIPLLEQYVAEAQATPPPAPTPSPAPHPYGANTQRTPT